MQHFKRVARAVADRKDDLPRRERVATGRPGHGQRRDVSILRGQPCHAVAEAHLAATVDDLAPEVLHDLDEHVRADVGLGVVGDVLRRAVRRELREHEADARIVCAGVELAVGKCARAALAELHVALRVERPARAKRRDLRAARLRVRPALEHDGPCARAREQQRCEHPRRAEAHDHGARLRRRDAGDGVSLVLHDRGGAAAADELSLIPAHGHADGVNIVNIVFLRASSDFLRMRRPVISWGWTFSAPAASGSSCASSAPVASFRFEIAIIGTPSRPRGRWPTPTAGCSRRSRRQCPAPRRRRTAPAREGCPSSRGQIRPCGCRRP